MTDIIWTGKLRKDYTAQVDSYTLRVEVMDNGCWWWACYLPSGEIGWNGHESNGKSARYSAIKAMNEHKNRQ